MSGLKRGFRLDSGERIQLKKGDEMVYDKVGGTLSFFREASRIFIIPYNDDKLYVGKEFSDNVEQVSWIIAAMIEADVEVVSDNQKRLTIKFV